MNTDCNLSLPYPKIETEGENPRYAAILSRLMAGVGGELTAIASYGFQTVITEGFLPTLSDTLDCISITEMRHFHMLSELIAMLGSSPVIRFADRRGRKQWWSSSFANYEERPEKFLTDNITGERNAINDYKSALAQIDDKYIHRIIERIILDEEHHIKIFRSFLDEMM